MIKVAELTGYKSLRALNAFSALMMGLKMTPEYMAMSYEDFLARVDSMPESDQRLVISKAAQFVKLDQEELEALISFCSDKNGVPYGPENLKNIKPTELIDIIVEVCLKVVKALSIYSVSTNEKKK